MSGLIFKPYNAPYIPTPAHLNYLAPHEPLKVTGDEHAFILNPDYPGKYDARRNDLAMSYKSGGRPLYMSGPDRVVYASSADMLLCKPNYTASSLEVLKRVSVPGPHRYRYDNDITCCNAFAVDDKHILIVTVSSNRVELSDFYNPAGTTYIAFRVARVSENDIVFTDYGYLSRDWSATNGGYPTSPGSNYITSNSSLLYTEAATITLNPSDYDSDNYVAADATEAFEGYVHVLIKYTQYPLPSEIGYWRRTTIQDDRYWVYTAHIDENGALTMPSSFYNKTGFRSRPTILPTSDRDQYGNPVFLSVTRSERHFIANGYSDPAPYKSYAYRQSVQGGRLRVLDYKQVPLEYYDVLKPIQYAAQLANGDMRFLGKLYEGGGPRYIYLDVNPSTLDMSLHSKTDSTVAYYGDDGVSFGRILERLGETDFIMETYSGSGEHTVPEYSGYDDGKILLTDTDMYTVGSELERGIAAVSIAEGGIALKSDVKYLVPEFLPMYLGTSAYRPDAGLPGYSLPNHGDIYNAHKLVLSRLKDDYYLQSGQLGMFRIVRRDDIYVRGVGTKTFPRFPNPVDKPVVSEIVGDTSAVEGSDNVLTILGVRFDPNCTVLVSGLEHEFVFTDPITLEINTQSLSAGYHDITVTNPDGQSYTYKSAFRVY